MPRPKKTGQVRISFRTSAIAEAKIIEIFRSLGYPYGSGAAYGETMEAIASGDLTLSKKKAEKTLDE
jgi:hypothetical protein